MILIMKMYIYIIYLYIYFIEMCEKRKPVGTK